MSDIRLVTLGPSGCGKTSIIKRFLFNTFTDKYKPTIEDLFSKEFLLNGVNIKVDILDTAGRVEFPAMRRLSISNASAFLFVYSVEKSVDCVEDELNPSLKAIQECFEEVKEIRGSLHGVPIIFVGNKSDLVSSNELQVGGHGSAGSGLEGSSSDLHFHSPNHPLAQLEGIEDLTEHVIFQEEIKQQIFEKHPANRRTKVTTIEESYQEIQQESEAASRVYRTRMPNGIIESYWPLAALSVPTTSLTLLLVISLPSLLT